MSIDGMSYVSFEILFCYVGVFATFVTGSDETGKFTSSCNVILDLHVIAACIFLKVRAHSYTGPFVYSHTQYD